MESNAQTQIDALSKDLKSMRSVFGLSIIAIAVMLMIVLPSVIRNSVFRVNNQPETKGVFSGIIEFIRGEELVPSDTGIYQEVVPASEAEESTDLP